MPYKRPANLVYAANEKPPPLELLVLALQYAGVAATFLILPVIIAQQSGAGPHIAASIVSIAMIMVALSGILQAIRRGPIGSGFLAPATSNPAYLAASLLAVKMGGLALLAGMTIFAGIAEACLSFVLRRMRHFFPPELGALVIAMIGFELGAMGLKQLFIASSAPTTTTNDVTQIVMGIIPLLLMFCLHLWGKGKVRIFSLLISMIVGYLIVLILGYYNPSHSKAILNASWFFIPHIAPEGYSFNQAVIIPFLIAALVCAIKVTGSLTALQQIQNDYWKRPDMANISHGIYADALTTVVSGFLGNMGLNMSSSCMALSVSTGISSRFIAFPFALLFIILAFCPKVALIFLYLPNPVVAAALIYLGTTLLLRSFEMLQPLIDTPKKKYIIGLSFMFGLSYDVYPMFYAKLPSALHSFTGSAIAVATLVALLINFIFTLRLPRHERDLH